MSSRGSVSLSGRTLLNGIINFSQPAFSFFRYFNVWSVYVRLLSRLGIDCTDRFLSWSSVPPGEYVETGHDWFLTNPFYIINCKLSNHLWLSQSFIEVMDFVSC